KSRIAEDEATIRVAIHFGDYFAEPLILEHEATVTPAGDALHRGGHDLNVLPRADDQLLSRREHLWLGPKGLRRTSVAAHGDAAFDQGDLQLIAAYLDVEFGAERRYRASCRLHGKRAALVGRHAKEGLSLH